MISPSLKSIQKQLPQFGCTYKRRLNATLDAPVATRSKLVFLIDQKVLAGRFGGARIAPPMESVMTSCSSIYANKRPQFLYQMAFYLFRRVFKVFIRPSTGGLHQE
ncbi:MAG: hypothetical protein CMM48_11600 [Rhodospirillaceae bacterium]|nr:hypothetical protein [Rhodospirillaceae bacterium]